jgi:ribose 1,5-bisphosphokinase
VVVHVTAPPEILAQRLAGRGRETEAGISHRLQRATIGLPPQESWVEIDNSGALEAAAAILLATIRQTLNGMHIRSGEDPDDISRRLTF